MEQFISSYIDEESDAYISLNQLLKMKKVSFEEAKTEIVNFKNKFIELAAKYDISLLSIAHTCIDLITKIKEEPNNSELQYIYLCIISDSGVLNTINSEANTDEQIIRNYFHQSDLIDKLSEYLQSHINYSKKLKEIRNHLNKTIHIENGKFEHEATTICQLIRDNGYMDVSLNYDILKDNIENLIMNIKSDSLLNSVKPYIIFAVLSRKNGMMQNRERFLPNIKSVFQYQQYNIFCDNGKNFSNYQTNIEFYCDLCELYCSDNTSDMDLCDFCFAYLSPLSEWYYTQCQPESDIPMLISRKIHQAKPANFPMLFCYEKYSDYDYTKFKTDHFDIYQTWEQDSDTEISEIILSNLYSKSDITNICKSLTHYQEYQPYSELFVFEIAETLLEQMMLDASLNFIEIE